MSFHIFWMYKWKKICSLYLDICGRHSHWRCMFGGFFLTSCVSEEYVITQICVRTNAIFFVDMSWFEWIARWEMCPLLWAFQQWWYLISYAPWRQLDIPKSDFTSLWHVKASPKPWIISLTGNCYKFDIPYQDLYELWVKAIQIYVPHRLS